MVMAINKPTSSNLPRAFGQYDIDHLIGRGESSRVFRAHHRYIPEHKVALKVLLSQETARIQRFTQEASIAARLRHPHISRLIDYGVQNPFHYTVFEYINGSSLRDLVKSKEHRLPPDKVLRYFQQIADALDYAHSLNIVHRDVTPGNILIDSDTENAYVIDFGIARDPDQSLTSTGMVMGTPGFIAPECMISANNATHLSDVFSLGVALFFMLTGELPWYEVPKMGESSLAVFQRVRTLAEAGVKLPGDVDRIIRVLLALDPSHRYAHAGMAAAELEAVLAPHFLPTQIVTGKTAVQPIRKTKQIVVIEPNEVEQALSGLLIHEPLERALERARMLDEVSIRQLLDQWSQQRPLRLPLLGRLAQISEVKHYNVFFFHLRLLIEQRRDAGVTEEPDTNQKPLPLQREYDRWQIELPSPKEFAHEQGEPLVVPGSERVINCPNCSGLGIIVCPKCKGARRITIEEPDSAQSATGDQSASSNTPVVRQRVISCPTCDGRGKTPCERCKSIGRLLQRKLMEWSRWPKLDRAQNNLPEVDEDWLHRTCREELVYRKRENRIPTEWLQITEVKAMIERQQRELDQDSRIVMAELQINFIPLTEIEFDLGNPEQPYRLAIYGFENLIPSDWRFLHWERILFSAGIGLLSFFLVMSLVFLAM